MVKRPKQTVTQKLNKKTISNTPSTVTKTSFGQRSKTSKVIQHRRQDIDFDRTNPNGTLIRKIGGGRSGRPALKESVAQAELATRGTTPQSFTPKVNTPEENAQFDEALSNRITEDPSFWERVRDFGVDKEAQAAKLQQVKEGTFKRPPLKAEDVLNALLVGGGDVVGSAASAGLRGLSKGGKAAGELSTIGQRVNVDKLGRELGFTADQTAALAVQVGKQRVSIAAKNALTNPYFAKTGRVALNGKTLNLKASYLTRMASTASDPRTILGLLGAGFFTSLFWAPNEKGDAMMTFSIVQRDAAKAGDVESVAQIDSWLRETNDIAASVPVVGFLKAEKAKFAASIIASEVATKTAATNSQKLKGGS